MHHPTNMWVDQMYAGLSLLKVSAKFNINGYGEDTAHLCKQCACLHTP